MDTTSITVCRLCGSKNLRYALSVHKRKFVFCRTCTLLQRDDNIPFEVAFEFHRGYIEVEYYPAFLQKEDTTPLERDDAFFFSLTALEHFLTSEGYTITKAVVQGYRLGVWIAKMDTYTRLKINEGRMRLDNQFTYFLWSLKSRK